MAKHCKINERILAFLPETAKLLWNMFSVKKAVTVDCQMYILKTCWQVQIATEKQLFSSFAQLCWSPCTNSTQEMV